MLLVQAMTETERAALADSVRHFIESVPVGSGVTVEITRGGDVAGVGASATSVHVAEQANGTATLTLLVNGGARHRGL